MATSVELRHERKQVREQQIALHERAESESRDLLAEEQESWDKMTAAIEALDKRIERAEELERTAADDRAVAAAPAGKAPVQAGPSADPAENAELRKQAFETYIRHGELRMSDEQRSLLKQPPVGERRAMGVGADNLGGYLVPDDYRREIERAMAAYGGMRDAATIMQTGDGADLIMPTTNDTGNVGERVGEHQAVTEQDVTVGARVLRAYEYSSKEVKVSLSLLQDSAFDVEAMLREMFGERIGRKTNTDFTLNADADGPTGIIIDAVNGKTAAATGAVTTDELIDLEMSVDRAYREGGRWMFHSNTLRDLRKLKDGDGRYIWQPGMTAGNPNTLFGYGYVVNDDMPTMATGNKAILFGRLQKYTIRDVLGITVIRLNELYAERRQVAFFAFSRHDGKLIDAGGNPVKCITMA